MIASSNTLSCNFCHLPSKTPFSPAKSSLYPPQTISLFLKSNYSSRLSEVSPLFLEPRKSRIQTRLSSLNTQTPQEPPLISSSDEEDELLAGGDNGGGHNGEERDWTTSFLLFAFWAALIYYVSVLAPNQTPVTDSYFLKKLLNLAGDDGFQMNQVIVALWYIMGLWPLVYSMLLLPTGRSLKSKIPVWPFLSLSVIGGAYALIPYFVLWKPPAPPVEESELNRWPLNFLESKLTAGITLAAGLAIIIYAFSSDVGIWKEFYQYFKGSKFIHIMSIDFCLFSTFAPFWVYNDMTARKWDGKGSWLLPISIIPLLGPALYLLLRPPLSVVPMASAPKSDET
ncbi:Unknown protein [Striga hermonthica]|uniref:Cardiolipin synthase N-terminal domain-containing protein n=1 Tax=Striga hermonthica TaxID=68872 RepID=A0A9N7NSN2_STRHE|nr:Unknown protein [Striga hermonthica]